MSTRAKIFIGICFGFLFPFVSFATVISENTVPADSDLYTVLSGTVEYFAPLGLTGDVSHLYLRLKKDSGTIEEKIRVVCYTNPTHSSFCSPGVAGYSDNNVITDTSVHVEDFSFASPITLDPTKYYSFQLQDWDALSSSPSMDIVGLDSSDVDWSVSSGNTDYWFQLTDAGGAPPADTSTHFISFIPEIGSTTPYATSTAFTFGAVGYLNDSDLASSTELHIRYRQLTGMGVRGNSSFAEVGDLYIPITAGGDFDLSTTTPVLSSGVFAGYYAIENACYSFFGINFFTCTKVSAIGNFIVDEASTIEVEASQNVLNSSGIGSQVVPYVTDENSTSTLYNLGSAFNLIDILTSKFPINWVYQYASVLAGLASSTATTTIPSVDLDFSGLRELQNIPTTTPISTKFTLFSAATLDEVAAISGVASMRTFVGWTLWLGLMGFAWRRVNTLFAKPRS